MRKQIKKIDSSDNNTTNDRKKKNSFVDQIFFKRITYFAIETEGYCLSRLLTATANEKTISNQSIRVMFVGFHSTDQVFRDTFVKLNLGPHYTKRNNTNNNNNNNNLYRKHRSCEDLLLASPSKKSGEETATTGSEDKRNNSTTSIERKLRTFRRKQDRKRSSHENVEVCSFQNNDNNDKSNNNNNNNNNDPKLASKDPAMMMSPVNLIGFKSANGHHFQEPHYEAIKDLSLKATFKIINSSNGSTPEGSPKMHSRKYVLSSDALLAEKISPMLERKKKLSGKKQEHERNPPLPKRNHSSTSQFYVENDCVVSANPIYGNTALSMNTRSGVSAEPCYTDVDFQQQKTIKNARNSAKLTKATQHKKQQHTQQIDHPYSEITPRPRRSARSSDTHYNDASPIASPVRSLPSPFSSHRFFNNNSNNKNNQKTLPTTIADGSKSDGDLSDSDVLDVPRLYDRRRSRTGNGEELADPSRFYEILPDKPKRRAVKQNYHGNAYEKDYVETIIRPRPTTAGISSSSSRSSSVKSLTYENGFLYRSSSEEEDAEPTYENPDLPRIVTYDNQQPTYENNELLHDEAPHGYACVRQTSTSTSSSDTSDTNYNNIVFQSRNEQLQYANIDLNNRHLYDNLSSPDPEDTIKSRLYSVTKNSKYTEIDFKKSDGLREAINQLRAGDKNVAPELDAEYKIDLTHIKFTRSSDSKRNSKNLETNSKDDI